MSCCESCVIDSDHPKSLVRDDKTAVALYHDLQLLDSAPAGTVPLYPGSDIFS